MIRSFRIQNFKSILDHEIELGRVNVFIGENGSGKTNILEALGYAAALSVGREDAEDLRARGIRVASPSMTVSSFRGKGSQAKLYFGLRPEGAIATRVHHKHILITTPQARRPIVPRPGGTVLANRFWWVGLPELAGGPEPELDYRDDPDNALIVERDEAEGMLTRMDEAVSMYGVYAASTPVLRGLHAISLREPLGLYGEALDVHLAEIERSTFDDIQERARCIFWLEKVILDHDDHLKFKGLRPGRGTSRLYFRDRFMQKKNNVFSAENANEGILHILFYLTLFASPDTPPVFAIDNIEGALNPQLCRELMGQLAELAAKNDKQALITTHNPAVLDGLNLHDDEQRLFVVSRNDDGHTVTRRIRMKPTVDGEKFKLSELWMRGHLGGLPERF